MQFAHDQESRRQPDQAFLAGGRRPGRRSPAKAGTPGGHIRAIYQRSSAGSGVPNRRPPPRQAFTG